MTTGYNELEEAWRKEIHSHELQPLRQGFFKDLASYVKRLREAQRNLDAKSLKAIILEEEISRLQQLVFQLLDRRLDKLWSQRLPVNSSDLDLVEKQAQESLSGIFRDSERLKQDLIQGRELSPSRYRGKERILVRFVREVPSIIGVDLKTHGPFHGEDVARLPQENAESLIRQGAAVEIVVPSQENE